ncbi:MAG: hypothetical protein K6F31_04430, partial [Acetatifactor sp.]|nr:hypothetical protein [Acetatifactor sp.]
PLHFRLLGSHLGFPGKHLSHLRLPESSFLFLRHVIVAAFACLLSTFRFSGKHFPPLLLAWIPFSSLKQAFPTSFTCPSPTFHFSGSRCCFKNTASFTKSPSEQSLA